MEQRKRLRIQIARYVQYTCSVQIYVVVLHCKGQRMMRYRFISLLNSNEIAIKDAQKRKKKNYEKRLQ